MQFAFLVLTLQYLLSRDPVPHSTRGQSNGMRNGASEPKQKCLVRESGDAMAASMSDVHSRLRRCTLATVSTEQVMQACLMMFPSIMRRKVMVKPSSVLSVCSGRAKGMFCPLLVNVAAHWYMPSLKAPLDTVLHSVRTKINN